MFGPSSRESKGSGHLSEEVPGRRHDYDGVSLLTVYLFLLVALPQRLVFAPMGGAGSPAVLVGLVCLAWWTYHQVRRPEPTGAGRQPVRTALFLLLGSVGVSYVVAMSRSIDAEESSTAQVGTIILLSWAGVLLVANDGIISRERFDVFLRRMVFFGAALAALGLFQFISGRIWVDALSIPGLSTAQSLGDFTSRGSFDRPPGTALHAIEFGAVLTMVLPLAINVALTDGRRSLVRRAAPALLISAAIVVSLTRSALVCAAVALLVLAVAWTPAVRRSAAVLIPAFFVLVFLTIPGMIATITTMFTGISDDTSATSRVDSYAIAGEFIQRSPMLGRGFSTFLPKYRILDNQYLLLIIEVGFVGLASMLALLITAMTCSRGVRRMSSDPVVQQSGQGLMAAVAAGAVGLALYDGTGFPSGRWVPLPSVGSGGCPVSPGASTRCRERGRIVAARARCGADGAAAVRLGRRRRRATVAVVLVTLGLSACGTDESETITSRAPSPTSATLTYPDATDTGVPGGVELRRVPQDLTEGPGWRWTGQGIVVTGAGTTLTGLDVTGNIEVWADDVTIEKSRITTSGDTWAVGARSASGLRVVDSTISGGGERLEVGVKDICGCSQITVLRNDIADWTSGIQMSRGVIRDNFVHDPKLRDGDHINGLTHNGGRTDGSLLIRHNTILNSLDQTDAIGLFADFGAVMNVTVDDNLLAGGSYSLYAGAGEDANPTSNVVITNNRFSTRFFERAGTFGPVCCHDEGGAIGGATTSGGTGRGRVEASMHPWGEGGHPRRIPARAPDGQGRRAASF